MKLNGILKLTAVFTVSLISTVWAQNWDAANITISNAAQLGQFRDEVNNGRTFLNQTITLGANIELTGTWTPIGNLSRVFRGTFDGNSRAISGLVISGNIQYAGLFGYVDSDGQIKNLIVNVERINASTSSATHTGGLAAYYASTRAIENCRVNVRDSISAFSNSNSNSVFSGGLIGRSEVNLIINNSYTTGNISASGQSSRSGGLVGAGNVTISNSFTTGNVYSTGGTGNASNSGGLVGYGNVTISNSFTTGNVYSTGGYPSVGGLVGEGGVNISNSFITGSVSANGTSNGELYIGGLVGNANVSLGGTSNITNSYVSGTITSTGSGTRYVGGIYGQRPSMFGTAARVYYNSAGTSTPSGGVTTVVGIEGKTIDQLRTQSTFENWDFTTVWAINSAINNGMPYLRAFKLFGVAVFSRPTLSSRTDNSITVNAVSAPENGQIIEYAISTSNTPPVSGWQSGLTFNGLTQNTTYYIFARSQENTNYYAGSFSPALQVKTMNIGAIVSAPTIASTTLNSITINPISAPSTGQVVEYAITTTSNAPSDGWQTGLTFTELELYATYRIFARSQANTNYVTGSVSGALLITLKIPGAEVLTPELSNRTLNSISINAVPTPESEQQVEYARSTSNIPPASGWQSGLTFSGLTQNTTYYIFARAVENTYYFTGVASMALEIKTIGNGATVSTPTIASTTHNSITINAISVPSTGQVVEYAITTSTTAPTNGWQTELIFTSLLSNTTYRIFARSQENNDYATGAASTARIATTVKALGAEVSTPELSSRTLNSISVNAVPTPETEQQVEYARSTSNIPPASGWQSGLTFSGLTQNTTYYIFARAVENTYYFAGVASVALEIKTIGNGAAVSTPTTAEITHNSITINAISVPSTGQVAEYAITTSTTAPTNGWQSELIFTGLLPNTTYRIFARSQENNDYATGVASTARIATTVKTLGAEVSTPELSSRTLNSITINAVPTPETEQRVEYARSTSDIPPTSGWQSGLTFSGLTQNTTYYIFARAAENTYYFAGVASVALEIKTIGNGAVVSTPTTAEITHNSITINAISVPSTGQVVEYAITTSTTAPTNGWQSELIFAGLLPNTTYRIFARSQENNDYATGAASTARIATTIKALGAEVSTPTTAEITHNSITINAISVPSTGQVVEYAIATSSIVPTNAWQTELIFAGLSPNTTYHIFARSQENNDYTTGVTSTAQTITTNEEFGMSSISLPQLVMVNQATQIHNGINLQATNNATVEICNLKGNIISKQNFDSGVYTVSLGNLPRGMYIVQVKFGNERQVLRVSIR